MSPWRPFDADGAVQESRRHYWSSRQWSHHRPHQSRHLCSIWRCRSTNPHSTARGRVRHHRDLQELDHVLPHRTFSHSDITYCGRSTWCTSGISSGYAFVHGVRRSDRKTPGGWCDLGVNYYQCILSRIGYQAWSFCVSFFSYTLQQCVAALHAWFSQNGLLPNHDKSEVMYIGTRQRLRISELLETVTVAGSTIATTDKLKVMGVVLDSSLTFDQHVRPCETQSGTVTSTCVHYAHSAV